MGQAVEQAGRQGGRRPSKQAAVTGGLISNSQGRWWVEQEGVNDILVVMSLTRDSSEVQKIHSKDVFTFVVCQALGDGNNMD